MPPSNQFQQSANDQPNVMPTPAPMPGAQQGPSLTMPAPLPVQQPQAPTQSATTGSDAQARKVPASPKNPNSTQNTLLIAEIRDNLVILNDGSARAVVTCRSINFDLMSDRERDAAEFGYQQMLNSLYFPVQICIRSQRVDLEPYLERLEKIRRSQDNMLLGVLMDDYIDFMSQLAQQANIMSKSFFIVVPYYPAGDIGSAVNTSKNFLANLFAAQSQQHVRIDEKNYANIKQELDNRTNSLMDGLIQMGIRSVRLNTKELGELYYNVYNPDTAVRQPIGNFEDLTATVITKGVGNAPQPHLDRQNA